MFLGTSAPAGGSHKKAQDLVAMAVAKASFLEPLQPVSLSVDKSVLIVGGGCRLSSGKRSPEARLAGVSCRERERAGGQLRGFNHRFTLEGEDLVEFKNSLEEI